MSRPVRASPSLAARRALLLGLAAAVAACAAPAALPVLHFRPAPKAPAARRPGNRRIVVEPFRVHGLHADRALVVRDAEGRYRQASGRNWVAPPSLLLAELLIDDLRAAYGAASVFAAQARIDGDVRIRPLLRRFERALAADGDQAVLGVDYVISDRDGRLLAQLVVDEAGPAGHGADAYVAAQSRLLARATAQLLTMLDTLPPAASPAP